MRQKKEKMDMMNLIHYVLWLAMYLVLIMLFVVAGILTHYWVISAIFILVLALTLTILGYAPVQQAEELIVEEFGEYIGKPLKAGPHFLFPLFGFIKAVSLVSLKEQILALSFGSKANKDENDRGDIEFADSSAPITSFFYYRVFDSALATYGPEDLVVFIKEEVEGVLRAFLANYTIDEAIALKNKFTLEAVVNGIKLMENNDSKVERDNKNEFHVALSRWGVEATKLAISDIDIPEVVKQQRIRRLEAEKDLEISAIKKTQAGIEKKITVIQASAEKLAMIERAKGAKKTRSLIGKGEASQARALVESGISQDEVSSVMIAQMKWEAVEKSSSTDKTIIMDNVPGSSVGAGAGFGAGLDSSGKEKK